MSDKPAVPVTLLLLGSSATAHDSLLSLNWLTAVEELDEDFQERLESQEAPEL
jgi:hypothetical protein